MTTRALTASWPWLLAGWTMLHYFWVGGLIGLLAVALRRALRKARPEVRYNVALLGLAALAVGSRGDRLDASGLDNTTASPNRTTFAISGRDRGRSVGYILNIPQGIVAGHSGPISDSRPGRACEASHPRKPPWDHPPGRRGPQPARPVAGRCAGDIRPPRHRPHRSRAAPSAEVGLITEGAAMVISSHAANASPPGSASSARSPWESATAS